MAIGTDAIAVTYTPGGGDPTTGLTLLLSDGFETGDTSNWQCDFFYQPGGASVQSSIAHSGTYALQLPASDYGAHAHCFEPSYPTVVFEAWINYDSSTTQGSKIFEGASFDGGLGLCTTAGGSSKPNTWAPFYAVTTVNPADNKLLSYYVRSDGLTIDPYACDNTQADGAIWQNQFQNQGRIIPLPTTIAGCSSSKK